MASRCSASKSAGNLHRGKHSGFNDWQGGGGSKQRASKATNKEVWCQLSDYNFNFMPVPGDEAAITHKASSEMSNHASVAQE
jgi:hypothetical protein